MSQQQHALVGAWHGMAPHGWPGKKLPTSVLHSVSVVCTHDPLPVTQQAPNTSLAQLMFAQVVPTPKKPPPFGRHSQA